MGYYAWLEIGNYSLFDSKNQYFDEIMMLFSSSHKKFVLDNEDGEERRKVIYSQSTQELSERLKVIGITEKRGRVNFDSTFDADDYFDYYDGKLPEENIDYDFFKKMFAIIVTNNHDYYWLNDGYDFDDDETSEYLDVLKYMLDPDYNEYYLGMPFSDVRYLLPLVLEIVGDDEVNYDITDLVDNYGVDENIDHPSLSRDRYNSRMLKYMPTIILTEGSSDAEILKLGLLNVYPHLFDLYRFFDFGVSNSSGGVGDVLKRVKSFVGAGIPNRIIAIFDNDTAGIEVVNLMKKEKWPSNIRILNYPNYSKLEKYPTVGPQNDLEMDINGLACSIELYLDPSILIEDNRLLPIMWKGYNKSMKQYQGEITGKSGIKKRFFKKVQNNPKAIEWDGIKLILDKIIDAYE